MNKIQKIQKLIIAAIFLMASHAVFAAETPQKPLAKPVEGVSVLTKSNKALSSPVVCNGVQMSMKQVEIINNTGGVIYPYIFIGKHDPVDEWLQACNNVNRAAHPTWNYKSDQVYRVYVGVKDGQIVGMQPKTVTTVNVPFYSAIVTDPAPDKPDSYINWWNGVRVSIIDDKKSLDDEMKRLGDKVINNADMAQLHCSETPPPDLPASLTYVCDSTTLSQTYSPTGNQAAFDSKMPEQLNEYTFGDINPQTDPYGFDPTNVGYNISYVDHFYLPIAIQTINHKDPTDVVGYVGTTKTVQETRSVMNSFVSDQKWPKYMKGEYEYPAGAYKLPGTYNVINNGGNEIEPNTIRPDLVQNWFSCVASKENPNGDYCRKVDNLFQRNYAHFVDQCALQFPGDVEGPISERQEFYVKHIYGWVAFDDCLKGRLTVDKARGFDANDLSKTVDGDFNGSELAYQKLQYTTTQMSPVNKLYFNPYVQLIHGVNYMGMIGAYAYSIDDRVGFMHFPGDGIIIAVGGKEGLPNPVEYDKSKVVNVGLGGTGGLKIQWASYETPNTKLPIQLNGNNAFSLANELLPSGETFDFPITVKDSAGSVYKFSIIKRAPFENKTASNYIKCDDPKSLWCAGLTVDYTGDGKERVSTIGTPPPVDVNDIEVAFGLLPPEQNPIYWDKYGLCKYNPDMPFDTSPDKSNKAASSFRVHSGDVDFPCQIVAQAVNGTLYYYTIKKPAPFPEGLVKDQYVTCGVGESGKSPTKWCMDGTNPAVGNGTPPNISSVGSIAAVKPFKPAAIDSAKFVGNTIAMSFDPAEPLDNPDPGALSYVYFVNGMPCDTNASTCTSSAAIKNGQGKEEVTLHNIDSTKEAKVTILATYYNLAGMMSAEVSVLPVGGIAINTITAVREQDPSKVDLTFAQPPVSGGTGTGYIYSYTVDGNKVEPSSGDPTTKVIFSGLGLGELKMVVSVEDSAKNKADAEVTIGQAPVNTIHPAVVNYQSRIGDQKTVQFGVTQLASGGTGNPFTYTAVITINGNHSQPIPINPTLKDGFVLSGFTADAATVVVTAKDTGDNATVASDPVTVPAAGGGFNPPVITKAGWIMPGTVAMEYAPASGGSGTFTYTYYVDDYTKPWTNFRVSGSNVLLQGLTSTEHHIKVAANDGKTVEFSAPFYIKAR